MLFPILLLKTEAVLLGWRKPFPILLHWIEVDLDCLAPPYAHEHEPSIVSNCASLISYSPSSLVVIPISLATSVWTGRRFLVALLHYPEF